MLANVSVYQQCDSYSQEFSDQNKLWTIWQSDQVTGAVDFRDRRPSKDGMPVEGVSFDKILALLPLKMLIFLEIFPAKQGFHSLPH